MQQQKNKDELAFFQTWLALELAPTLYGEKPGTLLNLFDAAETPFKTLWLRCGQAMMQCSPVQYLVLDEKPDSLKILFYHRECMRSFVEEAQNREFLSHFGYHYQMDVEAVLQHFKERFQGLCPHEMGIFLGIPLKDVKGFMGFTEECLTCQGVWQVYGDPQPSLCLMERFETSRQQAAEWFSQGGAIEAFLCGVCEPLTAYKTA